MMAFFNGIETELAARLKLLVHAFKSHHKNKKITKENCLSIV